MKYYELMYDYESDYENGEQYIDGCEAYIGERDDYCLSNGIEQNDWKNVFFEYDAEEGTILTDYISNVLDWLIVSEKCCRLIRRDLSGATIQILPVYLKERNNSREQIDCFALNVLEVIEDAIDMEKSKYNIIRAEDIELIVMERYVLKEKLIEGHDIFKLKEQMMPIFVSEKFKKMVEDNGLIGFDFWELKTV